MKERISIGRVSMQYNHALYLILALSLLFKLITWFNIINTDLNLFSWADSKSYHDTAVALHRLGTFSFSAEHPEIPQTYRTPGYPVFLASVYAVFGESRSAAILMQILISLLTIGLTYFIAIKVFDAASALLAALIVALDPISFTYSLKIMSETLFTLMIVAAVFCGIRLIQSRAAGIWAFCVGIFLVLATMVRPLGYYLVLPVTIGFLVLGLFQKWGWRKLVVCILLITLPSIVLIGAWKQRNYRLTGSSVYTSLEGFYAYFWQAASVIAARDQISLEDVQKKFGLSRADSFDRWTGYQDLHPETKGLTFEQTSEILGREGRKILLQHPLIFARVYISGVIRMLVRPGIQQLLEMMGSPADATNFSNMRKNPVIILPVLYSVLYLFLLYSGVLFYLWFLWRERVLSLEALFIGGVLLYLLAVSGGTSAFSRFRIPLIPLFSLLAANGYQRFRSVRLHRVLKIPNG